MVTLIVPLSPGCFWPPNNLQHALPLIHQTTGRRDGAPQKYWLFFYSPAFLSPLSAIFQSARESQGEESFKPSLPFPHSWLKLPSVLLLFLGKKLNTSMGSITVITGEGRIDHLKKGSPSWKKEPVWDYVYCLEKCTERSRGTHIDCSIDSCCKDCALEASGQEREKNNKLLRYLSTTN